MHTTADQGVGDQWAQPRFWILPLERQRPEPNAASTVLDAGQLGLLPERTVVIGGNGCGALMVQAESLQLLQGGGAIQPVELHIGVVAVASLLPAQLPGLE